MKKYIIILFLGLLGLSWYSAVSDAVNDPKELEAHLEKAEELENKGIYVDAVNEYEAALEYAPDRTHNKNTLVVLSCYPAAQWHIGLVLRHMKQFELNLQFRS